MERTISFTLNGKPASVKVEDERTLLWVLRSDLALTGTKFGCGEGLCGACTVIVDKQAVRSCSVPVKDVAGKHVMTIEGLGQSGLHAIQAAFVKHHAFQCGYCTPGMILNAYALLLKTPKPTPEQIAQPHGRQPVPLRRARSNRGCHSGSRRHFAWRCAMKPGDCTEAAAAGLSRRELLAMAGPGLFLCFSVGALSAQEPARLPARQGYPSDLNAYLRIAPDGRVTCFSGKVELGQGAMTVLAQILAEELDVTYDSVDVVLGDTELCPYDMGTFGSMNVRYFGPALRGAGAEAKAILLQMASEQLQAPAARLHVKAGVVTDPDTPGKSVTYGQLVQGKRIERHMENVPVKPVAAYTVVGHAVPRKDALDKVTGKAKYAGDFMFTGMLHARLVRPPAHGAQLKDADTSAAEKAGARVVRDGGMIAVLHERPDLADKALALVKAQFDRPQTGVDDKNIFDHLLKTAPTPQNAGSSGDLAEGEKASASIVEATYLNSYVAHAPMETHSATAVVENGKAVIWAGTQAPFSLRQQVAQALGLTPQNVRVITSYVGGGFGGKSSAAQAVEAARLAKATGKPVQVVWNRAEEFFYDSFRPAAVVKIRSGLTGAGKIALWDCQVIGAGEREAKTVLRRPQPAHGLGRRLAGWQPGRHASRSPWVRGARPPSTPTPSRANRRWTRWRPRPASTRWSSA